MQNLISKKLPELSNSFKSYVQNLNNFSDDSKPYIWKINYRDLEDISDENLEVDLPMNCVRLGEYHVAQAVIRNLQAPTYAFPKGQIVFEFSRDALAYLNDTQTSFLYVHEWLWDLSDNVEANRNLNYFLHSEQFEKMSAKECRQVFKSFGVNLAKAR